MSSDVFLRTRSSLLRRLKSWDDQDSWQDFFNTYSKLIHAVARKAGLSDAEAQDVVQETVLLVAKKMPEFNYDPAIGSFKSWLLLLTRRRIEKQLRKRLPAKDPSLRRPGDTKRTATIERIPDPAGLDLEAVWEEEWEKNLWTAALARVKEQISAKHYQMFDLYVLQEWPVKEVARALDVSVTHVYVNKHRVARLLKRELKKLGREGERRET